MNRTPLCTLKARVSCASIDVPEYQPTNRPASCNEPQWRHAERLRSAEDRQRPPDAQPTQDRPHRFAARHGGEHHPCATYVDQFRRRILHLTVNVTPRAELPG